MNPVPICRKAICLMLLAFGALAGAARADDPLFGEDLLMGVTEHTVTINAPDGSRSALFATIGGEGARPAVVVLSGPHATPTQLRSDARVLAAAGFAVLAMSLGDEESTMTAQVRTQLASDARAAYGWIAAQRETTGQLVGVLGLGQRGAQAALELAAQEPLLSACVLGALPPERANGIERARSHIVVVIPQGEEERADSLRDALRKQGLKVTMTPVLPAGARVLESRTMGPVVLGLLAEMLGMNLGTSEEEKPQ